MLVKSDTVYIYISVFLNFTLNFKKVGAVVDFLTQTQCCKYVDNFIRIGSSLLFQLFVDVNGRVCY